MSRSIYVVHQQAGSAGDVLLGVMTVEDIVDLGSTEGVAWSFSPAQGSPVPAQSGHAGLSGTHAAVTTGGQDAGRFDGFGGAQSGEFHWIGAGGMVLTCTPQSAYKPPPVAPAPPKMTASQFADPTKSDIARLAGGTYAMFVGDAPAANDKPVSQLTVQAGAADVKLPDGEVIKAYYAAVGSQTVFITALQNGRMVIINAQGMPTLRLLRIEADGSGGSAEDIGHKPFVFRKAGASKPQGQSDQPAQPTAAASGGKAAWVASVFAVDIQLVS